MFGLLPNTIVICIPSIQSELKYILEQPLSNNCLIATWAKLIYDSHLLKFMAQNRALIFVPYLDQEKDLVELLNCKFYSGSKNVTDKEHHKIFGNWFTGKYHMMVVTVSFGAGNDYQYVQLIIHVGTPQEHISFI